ncbi:MAG: hypothetical protein AAGU12_16730 [Clostridiales bacterium]
MKSESIRCRHCGAMIHFAKDQESAQCEYCLSITKREKPGLNQENGKQVIESGKKDSTPSPAPKSESRKAAKSGQLPVQLKAAELPSTAPALSTASGRSVQPYSAPKSSNNDDLPKPLIIALLAVYAVIFTILILFS